MSALVPDTAILPPQGDIDSAKLPVAYDFARMALAQCQRVDECKDWSDKASAIASYARQADDKTLLNHALRIQARAQRRVGELLEEYKLPPTESGGLRGNGDASTTSGGNGETPTTSQRAVAAAHGLSKDQEVVAKRAAAIPKDQFEAAVESDDPPTREQLSEMGKRKRLEDDIPARREGEAEATFFKGDLLRLLERCEAYDPKLVAHGVPDFQVSQTATRVGIVLAWLQQFQQSLSGRIE